LSWEEAPEEEMARVEGSGREERAKGKGGVGREGRQKGGEGVALASS